MSRPPLQFLQAFVSAARLGNLSRAAASMNVTVSALSHQMRQLEERLGYPLLTRHARGVAPTIEGRRLLEQIGPHLDAINDAFRPFQARRDCVLTVSAVPTMASAWLVPRLGRFVAEYPQIEINLQSSQLLVDFERQLQFDAALRVGDGNWSGLVSEPLIDEWLVPMASPALVERMGGIGARPLTEWPLLGDPDGEWDRWFALTGTKPPRRYIAILDDSESHHRAALDGVGVALGRVTRAHLLLQSGQLLLLSDQRLKTPWSHWLVYPERSKAHKGFLAFRQWLHAEADAHRRDMQDQ